MKILVRMPNWLGDLVMSAGFISKLSELYPDSKIHVIVKEDLSGLMKLFPEVVLSFKYYKKKYPGLPGIFQFAKEISKENSYNMFFCLPDSFSSAFMGFFTKSKIRIGYKNEFRSVFLTRSYNKPAGLHRAEEYAFLLNEFSPEALQGLSVSLDSASVDILPELEAFKDKVRIILNINSITSSRRVPPGKGAEIANALIERLNCMIVLIGSKQEKDYVNGLIRLMRVPQNIIDLTGKTTLYTLAGILKAVDLVISSDSGTAHLANSLGTKTIVLFGAGDERNTAPYNKKNLSIIRAGDVECAPCVSNKCKYGTPRCLEEIKEEDVLVCAIGMLKNKNE